MNNEELTQEDFIRADISEAKRLLLNAPKENVIDRLSLEGLIKSLEEEIKMGNMTFKSFPKISQFRNTIQHVASHVRYKGKDPETEEPIFDPSIPLPKLRFKGTTKLHGSNAGLIKIGNNYHCQSRQNCLNYPYSDNMGFGRMIHTLGPDIVHNLFDTISPNCENLNIYGEICGANIQKGVGIEGLPRMFVIFAAKKEIDSETTEWIKVDPEKLKDFNRFNVYHIEQFENSTYEVEVDFQNPELASVEFGKLTLQIEAECPVAKHFGVNNGVGEGLVWSCIEEGYYGSSGFWFKTKGTLHSVSKVKKVASVDAEKVKNVIEFVENTVTENRLEQAWQATRELHSGIELLTVKQTGDFIRWVIKDILDEEADTMAENDLSNKCIGGKVATKAKNWFFIRVNNQLNDKMGI